MNHWSETDFKQWLYGLKEEDSHLHDCSQCRAELDRLRLTRQRVVAPPEVSNEFLDAQRTLLATQNEFLQNLNDYWSAVFLLEQAAGMELRNEH